ncbi:MAG: succinate-semialdehyde dehydrogenase/glutarate-semialdehyde dehydrogenase, partial [Francisellaceae bacterium]
MAIEVINPATEEVTGRYKEMSQVELETIITDMAQEQKEWLKTSFSQRKELMLKAADVIRAHADEYARIITEEMGKPITQALGEVIKCAELCEYYATTAENY